MMAQAYGREYGFTLDRPVIVDDLRVRSEGRPRPLSHTAPSQVPPAAQRPLPQPWHIQHAFFDATGRTHSPCFRLGDLAAGHRLPGPAIINNELSTVVVEPGCMAVITADGDVRINVGEWHIPCWVRPGSCTLMWVSGGGTSRVG